MAYLVIEINLLDVNAQTYTDSAEVSPNLGFEAGKLICVNQLICGAVRFVKWN